MKIPPRTTAGTLQVLELAEIVQLIVHGRKSGRVTIQHGDDEGEIWFDNGAAVHARTANLRGNTAFYHMLTWCTGQFIIEHELATKERSLDTDTMLLVMDGMRLRDEGAVAAEEPNQDTAPADGSAGVWTALTLTALPAITLIFTLLVFRGSTATRADQTTPERYRWSDLTLNEAWIVEPIKAPWESVAAIQGSYAPESEAQALPAVKPAIAEPEALPVPSAKTETEQTVSVEPPSIEPVADESNAVAKMDPPQPVPGVVLVELSSRVKQGTLLLLADGEEISRVALSSESKGVKRFFQRAASRSVEKQLEPIALSPGLYEIVARLSRPNRDDVDELIRVEVLPGMTQAHLLVLGRVRGKPVQWKPAEISNGPAIDVANVAESPY